MRVQIPAYCDLWMRGDRYGEVVKTRLKAVPLRGQPGRTEKREVASVKLDISGKVTHVLLDDCTVVS